MDSDIEHQIQNMQIYLYVVGGTAILNFIIQVWNHVRKSRCSSGCCNIEIDNDEEKKVVKHMESAIDIIKRRTSREETTPLTPTIATYAQVPSQELTQVQRPNLRVSAPISIPTVTTSNANMLTPVKHKGLLFRDSVRVSTSDNRSIVAKFDPWIPTQKKNWLNIW